MVSLYVTYAVRRCMLIFIVHYSLPPTDLCRPQKELETDDMLRNTTTREGKVIGLPPLYHLSYRINAQTCES